MKNLKNKRGISLIVLVITIIVMIILATVIVLSLNNSGIIGNANKAKNDSDTATLKEYVNTLKLDWEFMTAEEKTVAGSFSEYATSKLEEKGYKRIVTEDGVILTEGATAAVKAGIEIGDEVTGYTLDSSKSSTTTSGKENTAKLKNDSSGNYEETNKQSQTVNQTAYTTWKYIGIGENGELLIAPDMSTGEGVEIYTIQISGKGGYLDGPSELDKVCNALYSTNKGIARSMNIEDINRILEYTPPKAEKLSDLGITSGQTPAGDVKDYYADYYSISKTSTDILKSLNTGKDEDTTRKNELLNLVYTSNSYWLASSCTYASLGGSSVAFRIRCVDSNNVHANRGFNSYGQSFSNAYAVRPVVALNPDVQLIEETDGNWKIN